ncbi:MAG: uracil-DNA glycosylase [Gammaproteobacteria bacterium]|nr:uracil-DNA glycosylase [Gammaproteobacteria bacterium]
MSENSGIQLDSSWLKELEPEFQLPYMQSLKTFLSMEKQNRKVIYPRGQEYFAALNTTPLDQVKVVILGQDPYHGPGQAHGLCFSVREGVQLPPSLVNIFKEIAADLGLPEQTCGDLTGWAQQGVLLLNSVLTVEKHKAASHQGKGWEIFTDSVISVLSEKRESCVFLLWGSYAQKKGSVIDTNKHLVLRAPHPSPLSAHRGFFGCKHFSRCNQYLIETNQTPIDWASGLPS